MTAERRPLYQMTIHEVVEETLAADLATWTPVALTVREMILWDQNQSWPTKRGAEAWARVNLEIGRRAAAK